MKSELESQIHHISNKKARIFKIGAVLFSVLLIVIFEFFLRLIGYGQSYDLFIEDKTDTSNWVINPNVSKKYFTNNATATTGIPKPFKKVKAPGTARIFILGASTGIGYPYRYNGSFHHWLEYGLNRTFTDQKFEIINVSLTAINTYTLLDFTKQIVNYEPDAALVYAGHNEYYGALGVASTASLGKYPWLVNLLLKLKTLRITQLISSGIDAINPSEISTENGNETLMKKMVQDQKIPFESELYYSGIHQFETNFNHILDIFDDHKVPVFVGTLVSNIKDVKPFISEEHSKNHSAQHYYQIATEQLLGQNFNEAKRNYIRAKELDLLRFRAPEAMNKVINRATKAHTNAILVDVHAMFQNYSKKGIIGNELLLEHVHPSIKGYGLLGFSYYEKMVNSNFTKSWKANSPMDFNALWEEMPITALDSTTGNYEIMMLKEGWPYYEKIPKFDGQSLSIPEQIAGRLAIQSSSWDEASQKLFQHYINIKDTLNALKVMEGASVMYPENPEYFEQAGNLALDINLFKKADYLYSKAFGLSKSMDMAKRIARNYIEHEDFDKSLFYLETIKSNEPNNEFATKLFEVSSTIIRLKKAENEIKTNPAIGIELAENFKLVNHQVRAMEILRMVLQFHPNNEDARRLLNNLN